MKCSNCGGEFIFESGYSSFDYEGRIGSLIIMKTYHSGCGKQIVIKLLVIE